MQTTIFKEYFLKRLEHEYNTTKKVLTAVSGNVNFKPDPKAKSAIDLAWHIATSELWFLKGIIEGSFGTENINMPENIKNGVDIVAWYEPQFASSLEKIKSLPENAENKIIDFFGILQLPAIMYLGLLLDHSIHHRGQLSTYLRPIGSKVPSIYGGSADEPFMG